MTKPAKETVHATALVVAIWGIVMFLLCAGLMCAPLMPLMFPVPLGMIVGTGNFSWKVRASVLGVFVALFCCLVCLDPGNPRVWRIISPCIVAVVGASLFSFLCFRRLQQFAIQKRYTFSVSEYVLASAFVGYSFSLLSEYRWIYRVNPHAVEPLVSTVIAIAMSIPMLNFFWKSEATTQAFHAIASLAVLVLTVMCSTVLAHMLNISYAFGIHTGLYLLFCTMVNWISLGVIVYIFSSQGKRLLRPLISDDNSEVESQEDSPHPIEGDAA